MSKIIFITTLLVGLVAQAASVPVRSFNSIAELTSTPTSGQGITVLLNGYTAANVYGEPAAYVHHPELSTTLHNPPMYIKEANSNGVWVASFVNSKQIPAEYFGVFPDGTDVTTNLQKAANFCRISENTNSTPGILDLSYGRTLVLGNKTTGAYTLNGTLYLNCNFDFSQAQIKASPLGTNVAIWVGPTGTNQLAIWNLRGKFPAVLYSTNAAYAEGTAITVAAVESCIFEYGFIEKYRIGTKFLGNNAGNARNIHLNNFANACRYAWWLESFGPNGFCNLNQYLNFNALATVVPPGGTNVLTGYEQLVMTTDGSLNGNVFIGGGIEGFASARFMVITNGTGNTFRDFRLEQYPTIFTGQKPYWEVISTIGTSHGQDNHLYPATTIGMFAPPVRQTGNAAGNSSGGSRQFHFTQVDADKPAIYLEPTRYASVPLFTVYGMPTGTTGETNALSNPELYKLAMTPDVLGGKPASASSLRWYIENDVGTIRWRNTVSQQKMSINETQLAARVAGAADDHFTLGSQTARLSWLTNGTETVGVVTYGDGTLQIAGTHPTIGSNNLAGLTITGDDRGTAVRSLMTYSHLVGDYVQTAFGSFPSNYSENATVRDWAGGYVVNSANSQNRGMRFSANATNQFIDLIVGPFGNTALPQVRVAYDTVTISNLIANTGLRLDSPTGGLFHIAGFESSPAIGTPVQLKSMTLANLRNTLYSGVNGVSVTGNQIAFNGVAGTGISLSTNGSSQLVIAASLTEGNGISISGATISGDYVPGAGIGFTTNGAGQITISNTSTNSGAGSTNGSALYVDSAYAQTGNFINSSEIDPSISGTNVTLTIVANSIATNKVDSTFRSFFKDRSTDTGTQTASTISDFADVQWANFTNSMVASNNISFAYDTSNKKLMISSTGGGGGGGGGSATNAPTIAVDGVVSTNVNFADSSELLVTKAGTNVTYALNTNGVVAGTYGGVTLTVNTKGLITSITSGTNTGWVTNQVDRPIFITMDAVTVASAVTNETSILGKFGANQTNIITANVLSSNKVIRIKASGTFTPPGSDWSGAYVRVKFGGRILTGQIAEMNSTQPSPGAWFLEASMHVRGSGSNATNVVVGYFANQESEPIANSGANIIALVPSGTLDTTINNTLDITFQNEATQPLAFTCNHAEAYYLGDDMITGGGVLTALDASWIVQGTLDAARLPSSVLLDSEAALLYGGLNNNNTWTGTQTFTNDVDFLGDVSFNTLTVSALQSTTWTNLGNLTVGSNLTVAGSATVGNGLTVTGAVTASGPMTATYYQPTAPWQTTYQFTEMYNQNGVTALANTAYPWGTFALAGGTFQSADVVSTNHPGISRASSAAANLSGVGLAMRPTTMYMEPGMRMDFIFRPLLSDTNAQAEFGWLNNININSPNQGLTLVANSGFLTVRGYNGSTNATIHSVSNAFTANTWYRGSIEIGPDGARDAIVKVVESDTGTSVMNTTFPSTNFPARTVAVGNDVRVFLWTSASATNICDIDYVGLLLPTQRR